MTGRRIPKKKRNEDEGPLFVKDDGFQEDPALQTAFEKAKREGRVDGEHRCSVCGMRFLNQWEADHCCRHDPEQ